MTFLITMPYGMLCPVTYLLCIVVILSHATGNTFTSSPLLHSNSQLANLTSPPAKNVSWESTPILFTECGKNWGYSDTGGVWVEKPLCSAPCPFDGDRATSGTLKHNLVFIWRTFKWAIHQVSSGLSCCSLSTTICTLLWRCCLYRSAR